MLLNILYYDQTQESKANNSTTGGLALGTIHITPQQVSDHAIDLEAPARHHLDRDWHHRRDTRVRAELISRSMLSTHPAARSLEESDTADSNAGCHQAKARRLQNNASSDG